MKKIMDWLQEKLKNEYNISKNDEMSGTFYYKKMPDIKLEVTEEGYVFISFRGEKQVDVTFECCANCYVEKIMLLTKSYESLYSLDTRPNPKSKWATNQFT